MARQAVYAPLVDKQQSKGLLLTGKTAVEHRYVLEFIMLILCILLNSIIIKLYSHLI